eukprot:TRINITY_DN2455_c0_g1_i2.p1 TRINITY_DN2455_c0_g1~~TRINITY_DN2455_c0_g1_i2.p1  ORF type:complete len:288 (-),score=47.97 TRINITY_DN2455_c0_g1_i2:1311-2174(-)
MSADQSIVTALWDRCMAAADGGNNVAKCSGIISALKKFDDGMSSVANKPETAKHAKRVELLKASALEWISEDWELSEDIEASLKLLRDHAKKMLIEYETAVFGSPTQSTTSHKKAKKSSSPAVGAGTSASLSTGAAAPTSSPPSVITGQSAESILAPLNSAMPSQPFFETVTYQPAAETDEQPAAGPNAQPGERAHETGPGQRTESAQPSEDDYLLQLRRDIDRASADPHPPDPWLFLKHIVNFMLEMRSSHAELRASHAELIHKMDRLSDRVGSVYESVVENALRS